MKNIERSVVKKSIYWQFIALLFVSMLAAVVVGYGFYYAAKNNGFMVTKTEDLEGAITNHQLTMLRLKGDIDKSISEQKAEIEAAVEKNWVEIGLERGYIENAPTVNTQREVYNRFINRYLADQLGATWYETAFQNIDYAQKYEIYILDIQRKLVYSQNNRWFTQEESRKKLNMIISNSYEQGYADGEYTYLQAINIGSSKYYLVVLAGIEADVIYHYSKCIYCAVAIAFIVFLVIMILGVSTKIRYIEYLGNVVKKISQGEPDVHIDIRGKDELMNVALNLNEMYDSLNKSIEKEIKNAQDTRILMTNLSHDLKTPITIVSGYLDVAKKEQDIDLVRTYVDKASDYANRMIVMVHNMLESFREKSEEMQHPLLNLSTFLQQIMWEYDDSEKIFVSDIDKDILFRYDASAMETMLRNILDNAIKYSTGSSKITVSLKSENYENFLLKVSNPSETVTQADLDRIFDRFYRTDKSRNSKIEGNGLGLSIAKSVAETHNGHIWAAYEAGEFSMNVRFRRMEAAE